MYKKLFRSLLVLVMVFLVGCSGKNALIGYNGYYYEGFNQDRENSEEYLEIEENDFINTTNNDKVNVSLDSSNAAYSNIRRLINNNSNISKDAVNIEQMINYFNYSYVNNTDKALTVFTEVADCPWNDNNKLLQIAIKAKEFTLDTDVKNNFVFLLDVSGSMYDENKLPLMINAFKLLIDNLNDTDRISIVTYAGDDQVLLKGGYGNEKTKISAIISDLEANGSTHGSAGIKTAYEIASQYFIKGGNNRVFLATDGDFNVGISSISSLEQFISEKRETGIYLSVFGFGTGNTKSNIMETLANKGNGNYYYIDSILEAQKVFVSELGGTLNTVAKDCKAQIEFNKDVVEKYRVIGYENKTLTNEEFNNSETDAGEIGAGHTTICLIEITLYSNISEEKIFTCRLKYKDPTTDINQEFVADHYEISENPSNDFIFASSVAEFGLILRDSNYKANASCQNIVSRINNTEYRQDEYKKEFVELVIKYMDKK